MMSAVYKHRMLYYTMMSDYLKKKVTILEFKEKHFHEDGTGDYDLNPYFKVLKAKLNNKEIFEKNNAKLLSDIEEQINAVEFSDNYCEQRRKDLNEDKNQGYTYEVCQEKMRNLSSKEKKFQEEYCDVLYDRGSEFIKEFETGAKALNIVGEIFFNGIWNFIDVDAMEYTMSDAEGFNPDFDTDEKALRKKIQLAYDVLERNKTRWL